MYQFKSLTGLTLAATIVIAIFAMSDLGTFWLRYQAVAQIRAGADPYGFQYVQTVGVVNLLVLLACVVVVGMWIYRASANAHSLSEEMTITPGWAVGWYFVPFANLVKPYQAMREIWMASHFRGNWHNEPTPPLLVAWWALWIICLVTGNLAARMDVMDRTGALIDAVNMLYLAKGICNVALCIVLGLVMRRITEMQRTAPYNETFA